MKYRARARARFWPRSKQCQPGGGCVCERSCPPPSPRAVSLPLPSQPRTVGFGVPARPAGARTERDCPTDAKRSCCPLWERGAARPPAAPGHARSPTGTLRQKPARCKEGEKRRVGARGHVPANQSPGVRVSLGSDSSRAAPCLPLQHQAK